MKFEGIFKTFMKLYSMTFENDLLIFNKKEEAIIFYGNNFIWVLEILQPFFPTKGFIIN